MPLTKEQGDGIKRLILQRCRAIVAFAGMGPQSVQGQVILSPVNTLVQEKEEEIDAQLDLMLDGLLFSCAGLHRVYVADLDSIVSLMTGRDEYGVVEDRLQTLRALVIAFAGMGPRNNPTETVVKLLKELGYIGAS